MSNYSVIVGKRVFLVEDQATNMAIVKTLLEIHGATVGFERWGADAARSLAAFAPAHLVLLDLMFPGGISGFDIFDLLRTVEGLERVPIVAVSASDPGEAIPRAREKGFAGFIPKPISFNDFPTQIATLLAGQEVWVHGRTYAR
jgi:CheY-like chemotaxis protein